MLVGLFLIQLPAWTPPEHLASPLDGIREGVRYMRDTPAISALMKLVTVYLDSRRSVPDADAGRRARSAAISMPAATERCSRASESADWPARCRSPRSATGCARGRLLAFAVVLVLRSLLIVFALVRSAALAYPLLLVVGLHDDSATTPLANSTLQHLVPNELRGRLMAAYSFVVVGLSQVVGSLVAGSVAHAIGVSWAIGGGAVIMLIYAYLCLCRPAGAARCLTAIGVPPEPYRASR